MSLSSIFPQHPADRPFPRLIQIPNPAAGADILFPCPANTRLEIIGIHLTLTTDANIANRNVDFIIGCGVADLLHFDMNILHAASTARDYHIVAGQIQPIFSVGLVRWCPAPPSIPLVASHSFRTVTDFIQVGDQYSAIYIFCYAFPDLVNMAPA